MTGLKKYWPYYAMMLIPGVIIVLFRILPLYGLQIAWKDYYPRIGIEDSAWAGWKHFRSFLQSPTTGRVIRNTLWINFLKLLFGFPTPIMLALLFNAMTGKLFKRTMQTISYMPQFLSWVIVYGFMYMLFNYNFGFVNKLITALGGQSVNFLSNDKAVVPLIIFSHLWKTIGWSSIVYCAVLGNINPEYYEAASIDGANGAQKLFYITLPSLAFMMSIMFLMQLGWILFGDFEQNLMFMGSSPLLQAKAEILETYIFNLSFNSVTGYSFATVVSIFQSIFGTAMVIVANAVMRRVNGYSIW